MGAKRGERIALSFHLPPPSFRPPKRRLYPSVKFAGIQGVAWAVKRRAAKAGNKARRGCCCSGCAQLDSGKPPVFTPVQRLASRNDEGGGI